MENAKKKKKFPWLLILVLAALLALAGGIGLFFAKNTLVEGKVIPVNSETLDLRDAGITDPSGLRRCVNLRHLDLRGNDVDLSVLSELQAALPNCEILYDVDVNGGKYDILTSELTLPDLPEDWERIKYLVNLTRLTVEKCTNPAAMVNLQEAMPDCAMTWSLGIGGQWFDVNSTELNITGSAVYFEELLAQLQWFPQVKEVILSEAVLTPDQQRTLIHDFMMISFSWPVQVGDTAYPCETTELAFGPDDGIDLADLESVLDLLPFLKSLDLTDSVVPGADRVAFRAAHPEIEVTWDVTLLGEVYSSELQMLDFNDVLFSAEDLRELDEAIPCFPQLEQIEMCDTGLTNEELDALNKKYENVKIVWKVYFCNNFFVLRTDATYFRPSASEYGRNPPTLTDEDAAILAYCTDMEALDLGHQSITDLSFLENMPRIKYLIVAECPIRDISPLSSLKDLKYLEIFSCASVRDFTPLIECKELKAVNVCYTGAPRDNAWETFSQMPQVDFLWYCNTPLSSAQLKELRENNPNLVTFNLYGGESSGGMWRYTDYYREMRDAMGNAPYMPGGTNGVDPETGGQIIIDDRGKKFILEHYAGEYWWWLSDKYSDMHPYIIGLTG